jgi:histidinol-phosphate phosphatase family protein
VITNQSGVARGLLSTDQVRATNARIDDLLGPFDSWQVCPHADEDGCECRKPRPGLVRAAATALGVPVERCAVIGDTAADVDAGCRAGAASAILVPNAATRPDEVRRAPLVCAGLGEAVDVVLARNRAAVAT